MNSIKDDGSDKLYTNYQPLKRPDKSKRSEISKFLDVSYQNQKNLDSKKIRQPSYVATQRWLIADTKNKLHAKENIDNKEVDRLVDLSNKLSQTLRGLNKIIRLFVEKETEEGETKLRVTTDKEFKKEREKLGEAALSKINVSKIEQSLEELLKSYRDNSHEQLQRNFTDLEIHEIKKLSIAHTFTSTPSFAEQLESKSDYRQIVADSLIKAKNDLNRFLIRSENILQGKNGIIETVDKNLLFEKISTLQIQNDKDIILDSNFLKVIENPDQTKTLLLKDTNISEPMNIDIDLVCTIIENFIHNAKAGAGEALPIKLNIKFKREGKFQYLEIGTENGIENSVKRSKEKGNEYKFFFNQEEFKENIAKLGEERFTTKEDNGKESNKENNSNGTFLMTLFSLLKNIYKVNYPQIKNIAEKIPYRYSNDALSELNQGQDVDRYKEDNLKVIGKDDSGNYTHKPQLFKIQIKYPIGMLEDKSNSRTDSIQASKSH